MQVISYLRCRWYSGNTAWEVGCENQNVCMNIGCENQNVCMNIECDENICRLLHVCGAIVTVGTPPRI